MATHKVHLHDGRVIWPDHKPLSEVLELQRTTPEAIWYGTYQGTPTRPGGTIYKASWWDHKNRYDLADQAIYRQVYARFISWDTAQKKDRREGDDHDLSAAVVVDLWPDYKLGVRFAYQERLEFPELPEQIARLAAQFNTDKKLRAVIVEDKQSGTSALQTLRAEAQPWLAEILVPFMPTTDKLTRAGQAAVWCKNDCLVFPEPREDLFWLVDLEDQLYDFPRAAHDDLVDAFSQVILYLEHYLERGYKARRKEYETTD